MTTTPRKILVATDFSSTADSAEKLAFRLARQLDSQLHLVHVRVIREDPLMAEEKQLEIEHLMSCADEATKEVFEDALEVAMRCLRTGLLETGGYVIPRREGRTMAADLARVPGNGLPRMELVPLAIFMLPQTSCVASSQNSQSSMRRGSLRSFR